MITVKDLYMLDDNIDFSTKWFVLDINGTPAKNFNSNEMWGVLYSSMMLGLENAGVEHWRYVPGINGVIVWLE